MWRRPRFLPILLLAFLALSACGGRDDGKETLDSGSESTGEEVAATPTIRPVQEADVSNPPLVALGEVLYQQQCAAMVKTWKDNQIGDVAMTTALFQPHLTT